MSKSANLFAAVTVAFAAMAPAARAQDTLAQRAINIQASFRQSLMIQGSKVLVLSNPALSAVKIKLVCFASDGEGKRWNLVIPGKDKTEIGALEGWDGGFVPGEWCEASYNGTALWTIRVP